MNKLVAMMRDYANGGRSVVEEDGSVIDFNIRTNYVRGGENTMMKMGAIVSNRHGSTLSNRHALVNTLLEIFYGEIREALEEYMAERELSDDAKNEICDILEMMR